MNIPTSVKIGATTYTVKQVQGASKLDPRFAASITQASQTIVVDGDMAFDVLETSFLHEVIHGMLYELGYTDHDEVKVDGLAHQLHQLIKNNPTMFQQEP